MKKLLTVNNTYEDTYKNSDLIYNIFIKNDMIYIISTIINNEDKIPSIKVNDIELTEYSQNNYEPSLYFLGPLPKSDLLTITINDKLYKNIYKNSIEQCVSLEKKNKLAFATLFKNDYIFLETFINHYRKQGVDCFYLYYHGSVFPENMPQGPDIIYILWNIQPYFWKNTRYRHNAQTAFLTMFQQKYFDDNERIILADLDEFIINYRGGTILELLNTNESDVISARNYWAKISDNRITYTLNTLGTHSRTKCIYKGSYNRSLGIHRPKMTSPEDCADLRMLHITNVLHPERTKDVVEPLETFIIQ